MVQFLIFEEDPALRRQLQDLVREQGKLRPACPKTMQELVRTLRENPEEPKVVLFQPGRLSGSFSLTGDLAKAAAAVSPFLCLKDGKREVRIPADEVLYITVSDRKVAVKTEREVLFLRSTLSAGEMPGPEQGFMRCHKAIS